MKRTFTVTVVAFVVLSLPLAGAATPTTAATRVEAEAEAEAATTSPSPPAASPTARRAETHAAARHPAIQSAIAALTKEVELVLRTGDPAPRGQSDFFEGEHDVPPAAVVAALRRPIASDGRAQAYVKWQLLSALNEELDETTVRELLQVYRTAPPPFPRPGIEKRQRDELDRMVRGAREADEALLAERFEQAVERVARDNAFVLAYRDRLFTVLPPSYDALAAGLEDAAARVDAGANAADHVRSVCKAIAPWAATAPPEQLRAMSRALTQLEKKRGQPYYNKLYWSAAGRMAFSKSRGSLGSVSQLDDARTFLDEVIRTPIVPLKLKDEP